MFRDAGEYANEELLGMCQGFFGGLYWAWYEACLRAVGEEATNRILLELAERFADLEVVAAKQLWGGEPASLRDLTRVMDVVHRVVAYEGPTRGSTPLWQMEGAERAHEKIGHCPIHAATPEAWQRKGPSPLCSVYCHSIGQKFYAKMGYRIEQDSWLARGEPHCGYRIERISAVEA